MASVRLQDLLIVVDQGLIACTIKYHSEHKFYYAEIPAETLLAERFSDQLDQGGLRLEGAKDPASAYHTFRQAVELLGFSVWGGKYTYRVEGTQTVKLIIEDQVVGEDIAASITRENGPLAPHDEPAALFFERLYAQKSVNRIGWHEGSIHLVLSDNKSHPRTYWQLLSLYP